MCPHYEIVGKLSNSQGAVVVLRKLLEADAMSVALEMVAALSDDDRL